MEINPQLNKLKTARYGGLDRSSRGNYKETILLATGLNPVTTEVA